MRKYGKILRLERQARKITQKELSSKIDITQQAISLIENDNITPSIEIIENIADFYGISIDELIEHEIKRNW